LFRHLFSRCWLSGYTTTRSFSTVIIDPIIVKYTPAI
jgi:hypothetical protein